MINDATEISFIKTTTAGFYHTHKEQEITEAIRSQKNIGHILSQFQGRNTEAKEREQPERDGKEPKKTGKNDPITAAF